MFLTTSETKGEIMHINLSPPYLFTTDHSNVVVLLCFPVACFGVRVSETFHLTCVHIILVRFGC